MLQPRKVQGETVQDMFEDQISIQTRKIIRGQANLLSQYLQQLRKRTEAGQEIAGRIWHSLLQGIKAELPAKFFYEHAGNYFWDYGEELSTGEQVFRKLLDQAGSQKIDKTNVDETKVGGDNSGSNNNRLSDVTVDVPALTDQEFDTTLLVSLPKPYGKIQSTDEDANKLFHYLIDILKVAAERTDIALWDWKQEDEELKDEIEAFNTNLKVAISLFLEFQKSPDMTSLMEAIENFSNGQAVKFLQLLSNDVELGSSSSEINNEEEDCVCDSSFDEIFDSDETAVNSEEKDKTLDLTKPQNDANEKEETLTSAAAASTSAPTPTSKPIKTGDVYIVKQCAMSKQLPKPMKPNRYFRNPQCNHAGYVMPASHYRDWKRDGYRCICGQRFRYMVTLDKHMAALQESRMLTCDMCEYKVIRKCCLDTHKRDYHQKPKKLKSSRRLYQCIFGCEAVLNSKLELRRHQKETQRQCKYSNVLKLPVREIPRNPTAFVDALKATCDRSNTTLSVALLDVIISAAEQDAHRLRRLREDMEKMKISMCQCQSQEESEV